MRPTAAAGLILVRGGTSAIGDDREVLLGRRHGKAGFMPNVYVFPGGRLDPEDRAPSGLPEGRPHAPGPLDGESRRHLPALARAALRETLEETGLLIGSRAQTPPAPAPALTLPPRAPWTAFAEAGLAPGFDSLRLIARAITPASSPVRFHTRFFLCQAEEVRIAGGLDGDGELVDIGWKPLKNLERLAMSVVTRLVLAHALATLAAPRKTTTALFAWRDGARIG